jgi:exopolyphosphatase/guanosine-5'-triphosphate,3'-diphosphate pyrophosphatase
VSSIDLTGAHVPVEPGARHAGAAAADPAVGGRRALTPTYAALDLGTNNCRLLVARPARDGFRIVDAFSRIVRLGEGMSHSGRLGEAAIVRTLSALEVCRDKMEARGVSRARLIATEACRIASNGADFIARVRREVGLELEIVDRKTEAHLAAAGCASLADPDAQAVLLFDIGGGSSEIVWLGQAPTAKSAVGLDMGERVRHWASLQLGVVTLAERFGGFEVTPETYLAMIDHVRGELAPFIARTTGERPCGRFHLLGTSGTVTTIAGVHLGLLRYDRRRIDGIWMSDAEVTRSIDRLREMTYDERAANGCIGTERADLVLAGCAIFDAIRLAFPAERIRIADRGLREGILMQLMNADRVWPPAPPGEVPRR